MAAEPNNGTAEIRDAELHHLRDVMRLREGAAVTLLGGNGNAWLGTVGKIERHRVLIDVVGRVDEKLESSEKFPIILAASIVKGPRMDFLVEKAAELGVAELWPIVCERTVVKADGSERVARWRRLADAAIKQSFTTPAISTKVRSPQSFEKTLRDSPSQAVKLLCNSGGIPAFTALTKALRSADCGDTGTPIILACGPEGDFTDAEIGSATQAHFSLVGLGPKRLRSETAAMVAVTLALAAIEQVIR